MRRIGALVTAYALAACSNGDYAKQFPRGDASLLSSSGGEVSLADGSTLGYLITSDRYKQWDAASKGLSRGVSSRFGALLQPNAPTEQSIDRAVAYLEGQARAREAIQRAGMSVKDFVLMTVALERQMQLASEAGGRSLAPAPEPLFEPLIIDSGYLPDTALPIPIDSGRRVDTVYLPVPDTALPRRDTVLLIGDTLPPKRDTLWLKPPPRDTARDTMRILSPPPPPLPPPLPPRDSIPVA